MRGNISLNAPMRAEECSSKSGLRRIALVQRLEDVKRLALVRAVGPANARRLGAEPARPRAARVVDQHRTNMLLTALFVSSPSQTRSDLDGHHPLRSRCIKTTVSSESGGRCCWCCTASRTPGAPGGNRRQGLGERADQEGACSAATACAATNHSSSRALSIMLRACRQCAQCAALRGFVCGQRMLQSMHPQLQSRATLS